MFCLLGLLRESPSFRDWATALARAVDACRPAPLVVGLAVGVLSTRVALVLFVIRVFGRITFHLTNKTNPAFPTPFWLKYFTWAIWYYEETFPRPPTSLLGGLIFGDKYITFEKLLTWKKTGSIFVNLCKPTFRVSPTERRFGLLCSLCLGFLR